MALRDEEFIVDKVIELTISIGRMMGVETVKELIQYDLSSYTISDEEIENIYYIESLKLIEEQGYSKEDIAKALDISIAKLEELYDNYIISDPNLRERIQVFTEQN